MQVSLNTQLSQSLLAKHNSIHLLHHSTLIPYQNFRRKWPGKCILGNKDTEFITVVEDSEEVVTPGQ